MQCCSVYFQPSTANPANRLQQTRCHKHTSSLKPTDADSALSVHYSRCSVPQHGGCHFVRLWRRHLAWHGRRLCSLLCCLLCCRLCCILHLWLLGQHLMNGGRLGFLLFVLILGNDRVRLFYLQPHQEQQQGEASWHAAKPRHQLAARAPALHRNAATARCLCVVGICIPPTSRAHRQQSVHLCCSADASAAADPVPLA